MRRYMSTLLPAVQRLGNCSSAGLKLRRIMSEFGPFEKCQLSAMLEGVECSCGAQYGSLGFKTV